MASIFTRIINGEIPSYKILEDDTCLAFLDVFPLVKGHTLVVPKIEVDNIFDLDEVTYSKLFSFSRKVESMIRNSIPCKRVGIAVVGLEVPHAHIHLVPLSKIDDINFTQPKLKFTKEELFEIQQLITQN